eukprot:1159739-Pelagomonas_calceolata.AAC.3
MIILRSVDKTDFQECGMTADTRRNDYFARACRELHDGKKLFGGYVNKGPMAHEKKTLTAEDGKPPEPKRA